jgi:hypothetical protein
MVKAAQHRAGDAGFAALLADTDDDAGREQKLIHALAKDDRAGWHLAGAGVRRGVER